MENSPKKSKAFIITFIAVLILLVIGYFLFRNAGQTSDTKGTSSTNKIFSSLFGTSKSKDLKTIDNSNSSSSGSNSNNVNQGGATTTNTEPNANPTGGFSTGNFSSSGNLGNGDGLNNGGSFAITPPFNPISTPKDTSGGNGGGGSGNGGGGNGGPTPTPDPIPTVSEYCPYDPLEFTDAEKTQLDALLKDYYMIAPLLKSSDDLALLETDISTNKALVDQAGSLTNECLAEKTNINYTGPSTVKDNPYYSNPLTGHVPYVPSYDSLEQLFNIW